MSADVERLQQCRALFSTVLNRECNIGPSVVEAKVVGASKSRQGVFAVTPRNVT